METIYNKSSWCWKLNGVIFSSATMSYVEACPDGLFTNIDSEDSLYSVLEGLAGRHAVFTNLTQQKAAFNSTIYELIHAVELNDVMGRPAREAIAADPTHLANVKYAAIEEQIALLSAQLR